MGVLIGDEGATLFSYVEYQALTLGLGALTFVGLIAIEFAMKRFQVLPVLFPGMFSLREKRFFFFDVEVKDGTIARLLKKQAKMLVRMTLFIVLAYLWQHCVIQTSQQVGRDFPKDACDQGFDCFASPMHYSTFLTQRHEAVDCHGIRHQFEKKVVVSCIMFVKPSAQQWLMHVAIAHSLTQMNMKIYEFLVWTAGNSPCIRRLVWVVVVLSSIIFLGLFFGGVMLEFVSSWLSFVMSLSLPVFMFTVWKTSTLLEHLWNQKAKQAANSLEEHFQQALAALPAVGALPEDSERRMDSSRSSSKVGLLHMRFPAPPKLSLLFARRGAQRLCRQWRSRMRRRSGKERR